MLCHPADSSQWKNIDHLYPDFGKKARNLRLGLATDGMNPYGSLSTQHSSWQLSMMILSPRQPGNDIDVYLSPLVEDLRNLWDEGVVVFDAFRKETFEMRAMLFCTIND